MKEREISLLELFIETLLRWRVILIWAAVGAVLAGAFSYVRSGRASQDVQTYGQAPSGQGQDVPGDLSSLEDQLTDAQLQNVNYVIAYESAYSSKLSYKEQSLLMQIDPDCVQRADLTFYVDADNWRRAGNIEKAYEDIVQTDALGAYVAGRIGRKGSSISELITLARGSGSIAEGTNTFRVRLICYDKAVLDDMAESVIGFIQKKHGQIEEAMGKHEIVLLSRSDASVADMDILDRQKNIIDEIDSMETAILQYKDAFTAEQQQYYDFVTAAEESERDDKEDGSQEPAESGHASGHISIRYVVLGMFLAAFMYVFFFFMRYVFNHKLSASDSLQDLYGIPQLGLIPHQQESRKPFGFVDQWILSLRDSGGRRFTKDEAVQLSAAAVKMAAVKEGTGKICLVGCGLTGQALEVCEVIRDELAKEGIRAEILNNVLYDAQAMYSLEGAGAAVLVERAQSTLYSEIARETELFARQGITILGGIITA